MVNNIKKYKEMLINRAKTKVKYNQLFAYDSNPLP